MATLSRGAQTGARGLLRIQDGCDEHCTFCMTTLARGSNRSRPREELIAEAVTLAETHPEIVLTGIHIGSYGLDIGSCLSALVERLIENVPSVRFRLSSLEATEVDDRLRGLFGDPRRLAPYLHAPLQSGSDRVLKRMGRSWYTARTYAVERRADYRRPEQFLWPRRRRHLRLSRRDGRRPSPDHGNGGAPAVHIASCISVFAAARHVVLCDSAGPWGPRPSRARCEEIREISQRKARKYNELRAWHTRRCRRYKAGRRADRRLSFRRGFRPGRFADATASKRSLPCGPDNSPPHQQQSSVSMITPSESTVYIETYGCQMNVSDSELILGKLAASGYRQVDAPDGADVILVNTCAIREHAEQRVIGRLGEMKSRMKAGAIVGVTGCMAQRLGPQILERASHVSLVIGPDGYRSLPLLVENARRGARVSSTDFDMEEHYEDFTPRRFDRVKAWIPVQRGCDYRCTYCIVPDYTRLRAKSPSGRRHPRDEDSRRRRNVRSRAARADGEFLQRRRARLRRSATRRGRGGWSQTPSLHQSAPQRFQPARDCRDGRYRGGLRARPSADAVGIVARPQADAEALHAREIFRVRGPSFAMQSAGFR